MSQTDIMPDFSKSFDQRVKDLNLTEKEALNYLNNNKDLIQAYCPTPEFIASAGTGYDTNATIANCKNGNQLKQNVLDAASSHWKNYGQREGRTPPWHFSGSGKIWDNLQKTFQNVTQRLQNKTSDQLRDIRESKREEADFRAIRDEQLFLIPWYKQNNLGPTALAAQSIADTYDRKLTDQNAVTDELQKGLSTQIENIADVIQEQTQVSFRCAEDGTGNCVKVRGRAADNVNTFSTIAECQKTCAGNYSCNTNDQGLKQCVPDKDGDHKGIAECQQKCNTSFGCVLNSETQLSSCVPNGCDPQNDEKCFGDFTSCQDACTNKYSCVTGSNGKSQCILAPDGVHASLDACESRCATLYTCSSNKGALNSCQPLIITKTNSTAFKDNKTAECYLKNNPSLIQAYCRTDGKVWDGTYDKNATLADCKNEEGNIKTDLVNNLEAHWDAYGRDAVMYNNWNWKAPFCPTDGVTGPFTDLTKCQQNCQPSFDCVNGQCVMAPDGNGEFKSMEWCKAYCLQRFDCSDNYTCESVSAFPSQKEVKEGKKITPEQGRCMFLKNQDLVQAFCHKDGSEWEFGQPAVYDKEATLQDCTEKSLKALNTWYAAYGPVGHNPPDCLPVPGSGIYKTQEKCANECRPPIMVPQGNVDQKSMQEELINQKNLEGALDSGTLQVESWSLNYLVFGMIVVTVIGLIAFYMSGSSNSVLSTILIVIISLVIIWLIIKYIMDNLNR